VIEQAMHLDEESAGWRIAKGWDVIHIAGRGFRMYVARL
jgi:hypothetical protein